jgi:hypothetical protein
MKKKGKFQKFSAPIQEARDSGQMSSNFWVKVIPNLEFYNYQASIKTKTFPDLQSLVFL